MAKYGAKYLKWAPFGQTSPDADAAAFPKYGTPMSLGSLVKVTDSPEMASGTIYGDDVLEDKVDEFKECGIDLELTDITPEVFKAVLGARSASGGEDNDVYFTDTDNPPYGGLAFFIDKIKNGVKSWQGIYYPKIKGAMQGDEYTTKGDNITLTGGKLKFSALVPKCGRWKVISENFATAAAAQSWVDDKIKATP